MSSQHSQDSTIPKSILVPSPIVTSNTQANDQDIVNLQPSAKTPLRPNAPSLFQSSPLSSVPSTMTSKAECGNRIATPSSTQLCVLDSPALRTPPPGSYPQTPEYLNTAPMLTYEAQSDYFQGQGSRASIRSRNDLVQASQFSSPLYAMDESPTSPSTRNSFNVSDLHSCTTDSIHVPPGPSMPYKVRRPSSDSLTMVNKMKRRKTDGGRHQQKYRCKGTCTRGKQRIARKIAESERKSSSLWGLYPSQVIPTAPEGIRISNALKEATPAGRRRIEGLTSEPAPPLISRRWSSVEIGTCQLKLPSLLRRKPRNDIHEAAPVFRDEIFKSKPLGERNRSSSFTAGASYNDIVRSLRERLIIRELPSIHMLMPSAITLRRPSAADKSELSSLKPGTSSAIPSLSSRQPTFSENQAENSDAYIITREDVDAVMEILQATFDTREIHTPISISRRSSAEDQSPRGTKPPSLCFTPRGVIPLSQPASSGIQKFTAQSEKSEISKSDVPAENTPLDNAKATECVVSPKILQNHLQISQINFRGHGGDPGVEPAPSVHEVIWEEQNSYQNSHLVESDCSSNNTPVISPGIKNEEPSFHALKNSNQDHRPNKEKFSFDPKNARTSISNWSWQCESETNEYKNSSSIIPEQEVTGEHVVSFPPLPRKPTNEWRSPLPEMMTSILDPKLLGGVRPHKKQARQSHSLYSIGIDARTAPSSPSASGIATSPATQTSWLNEQPVSPPQRVCSWLSECVPEPLSRQKSDTDLHRQKSIVKAHPNAPARSGNISAIGSSIGSCTGARRRASVQVLANAKKIAIFDDPLIRPDYCYKRKSWFKSIHDTALPKFAKGGEVEEASFWSTLATRHSSKAPVPCSTPSPPASPYRNFRDALSSSSTNTSPQGNIKSTIANGRITQPLISPSISEMPLSPARDSLSMIQDKYPSFSKLDFELNSPKSRRSSSPRKLTAYESLLKIHQRFPTTPKPDHSGIYDSVTGIQRKDRVDCLRDCQLLLHNCNTCINMSPPSVDWIG